MKKAHAANTRACRWVFGCDTEDDEDDEEGKTTLAAPVLAPDTETLTGRSRVE